MARLLLLLPILVCTVFMACAGGAPVPLSPPTPATPNTPDVRPDSDMSAFTARLDEIEARLIEELSTSLEQQQSIAAIQLELETLRLQLGLALAVLKQEPSPEPTIATSAKNREDICYRALPVQEALLDKFTNINLCRAVGIEELFRLERLTVEAIGTLSRTDFADMPNLRRLEIRHKPNNIHTDSLLLGADALHDLTGLESLSLHLNLTANSTTQIPALDLLPPNLKSLELYVSVRTDGTRWPDVVAPPDMLASTPNLERLLLSVGGCAQFHADALAGLNRLIHLEMPNGSNPLPDGLFRDLVSLAELRVSNNLCTDGTEEGWQRRVIILPTHEVLARLEDLCWSGDTRCEVLEN